MNTFVLLGLVVLLVLFLVRSKRKRAGSDDGATTPGRARGLGLRRREAEPDPAPAAPAPQHDPFAAAGPAPFAAGPSPFGGGGAPVESFPAVDLPVAAAPSAGSPAPLGAAPASSPIAAEPGDWLPEEMIVEPGWPLPGEIAGAWGDGPSTAAAAPVATVEAPAAVPDPTPVAETAATVAPPAPAIEESWEMPALDPVQDTAPVPVWQPEPVAAPPEEPLADADLPLWRPEEPVAAEPVAEPVAEDELPVWRPDPDPLSPVAHITPAPPAEPVVLAEREPEPVVVAEPEPLPVWEPAVAEVESEPAFVAAPIPVEVAPAPVEIAPAILEVAPAPLAPTPASAEWPAEVATLLPAALGAVRPLVTVCDHVGVTPRMLVVMRALADAPLSVGEQAALLGVSRPVVADVTARLESLGLTRREGDPADRRRVRIGLTPKGRRVVADSAETPSADRVAVALAGLDDAGRASLVSALRTLAGSAS